MGSTEDFLRLLNEQNTAIAAREAELLKDIPVDPVRVQKDQERREKWGQLRAREHPSKRPKQAHSVFGYVDPT
jgi:hypothetical protein